VAPLDGPDVMQDPDECEAASEANESWGRLSPVPFLHKELRSFMSRPTTEWRSENCSFLLFGPPGTAKSTLARSLAQCLQWHFLELTPSNFVEAGLEMIEQRSREIFAELGVLRETVVLFDELDSLLTDREQLDRSSILNFTVPAMLPKLQALTKVAKKQRLVLIFATNFYDRLDPAMARRGRIDERLLVLPPNATARRRMLSHELRDGVLDRGVAETSLAVYEDLRRYRDDARSGKVPTPPYSGITPALYFSRLPATEHRMSSLRSTERLAVEVAEVVGRLLSQSRALNADAGHAEIVARLEELKAEMSESDWPEWLGLCDSLIGALSPSS
jgi:adenylate kinase family enzyme